MAETDTYLLSQTDRTPPGARPPAEHWKPLRLFNLYRLVLSGLFVALSQNNIPLLPLGLTDPRLFYWTSILYLTIAGFGAIAIGRRRPTFPTQVYLHVGVDIVAITLLMHASGGLGSGLGMLLVVSIASASILVAGRTAGLFAAMATLAVLVEQIYTHLTDLPQLTSYPQAGMVGIALFATAILAQVLARRAGESEALAARRGVDLANMAQLTEYVIQHMQSGVLVVDDAHRIRLMNSTAWSLLGQPSATTQRTLESVSSALAQRLRARRGAQGMEEPTLQLGDDPTEILPLFMPIGSGDTAGTLVFLEDASQASRQAQQLKLASLGRLTASIAHEVRNPLGAISHAGELLAESPHLDNADQRLVQIIVEHSMRVNTIIENVLQLGRRDRSHPLPLDLGPWLENFVDEFVHANDVAPEAVTFTREPGEQVVRFDPTHLHQILWNLCQNGLHHSKDCPENPRLGLHAGRSPDGHPFLDVVDHGPGIPPEAAVHIFEPFFTTEPGGTGLGLYIASELTKCNDARLHFLPTADGLTRFRVSFGES